MPILVVIPPKMVANDNGMRVFDGERLASIALCMATGIIRHNAPTLFINADNNAATRQIELINQSGDTRNGFT